MGTPTNKSPAINKFLNDLLRVNRNDYIENNICITCGRDAKTFDSELCKREFNISGMCQGCQNITFGPVKNEL